MKALKIIPGFIISLFIAVVARFIESLFPIHIIGASVIALFIGMIINLFWKPDFLSAGIKFTSKRLNQLTK